jgi:phosphoglycerate-specific signal transduction histidine kinase
VGRGPAGLSAPQVKRRSTCCAIPIEAIGETGRGWIAVQAKRAGDFAEIAVRDSGPGFPPDLAANPFLPFASTKAEGLGIGVALSRLITRLMAATYGSTPMVRAAPCASRCRS